MPAVLSKPVTKHEVYNVDEGEYAIGEAGQGRTQRPQKCGQANSSPLSECFQVVINHKVTPFKPSSPQASTPAKSEPTLAAPSKLNTSSQAGEGGGLDANLTEVKHDCRWDKTKYKRMKKAPKIELEDMIARIKASKS
ncbi:hypothetical protein FS749_005631 [Ceratobasidium sp. UAMH 11750]|nr:hypothetical protein FS749_005631 [Ceratobasidium sp. UAMH 11750]